jgi:hypothetical protein
MAHLFAGYPAWAGATVIPALLAGMLAAAPAHAENNVVVTSPSAAPAGTVETGMLPNPYLLRSGVFTLGASYVPALVVAISSDRSEDKRLYAPVVGPWLDLADRQSCSGGCSTHETVNRVLLVTDGVFQGIGVLQIVGSLIFPVQNRIALHDAEGATKVAFSITPASFGAGANGFAAVGEF